MPRTVYESVAQDRPREDDIQKAIGWRAQESFG